MTTNIHLFSPVTSAVASVWGANRVGVRLSPSGKFNSMHDSNPAATFSYVAKALNRFDLAYLHLIEPRIAGNETVDTPTSDLTTGYFRSIYKGTIITAGGYNRELGDAVLAAGDSDLVAFGRLFISNPDLPKRFARNAQLNQWDRSTFYGGGEKGYTDYPFFELQAA